jgi:hypothetical protein
MKKRSLAPACAGLALAAILHSGPLRGQEGSLPHHPGIGYPERSAQVDVLPGFRNVPPGYGEVSFYWWLGDTLTRERILWQLEQLAGRGITGLQVNYAHSDSGGNTWGLTYPSQPKLFSQEWWRLFGWFLKEARKRGMSVSLSDYTLARAGQGWFVDEMLRENPLLSGSKLLSEQHACEGGADFECVLPENLLSAGACRTGVAESAINLIPLASGKRLHWKVPPGKWTVVLVYTAVIPGSLDPMNPMTGKMYVEKFFQPFEDHCPGEGGKGLNFFFSDELDFGIRGWLWNDRFAAEFRKRKGYDVRRELPALFVDAGKRTPKIRMDYSDVMVALSEEGFFKPVYEWHARRGMIFGCDHGGRGTDVTEFGDYFRTQRWMSGPGCDQPELSRSIVKNKVASSIAHLYERPRTWLEGFHSSNWGTTSAQVAGATFANFAMGQNLLSFHGLYYSTHGSWWEWAPPDNHFRQPYWAHMGEFLKCTERLSYILSQGHHRCDVAVVYPVAPVEAGMKGSEAVACAFRTAETLYSAGIDFDFIDFESLARAKSVRGELRVSGEIYRALILPAMSAARYSTVEKALEFHRAGGIVVAVGSLPEASDRSGRDDPRLQSMVSEIFGVPPGKAGPRWKGFFVSTPGEALGRISSAFTRDFEVLSRTAKPFIHHRRVGERDIYFVYGVPKGSVCMFRSGGKAELWNPWNGTVTALGVISTDRKRTRIRLPLDEEEPQLIVFSPGKPELEKKTDKGEGISSLSLSGEWEFELKPTLDNRWGDYRLPAFDGYIGVEASRFRYTEEKSPDPGWESPQLDDSSWAEALSSYGEQFWMLGPLPEDDDSPALESRLSALDSVDPSLPVNVQGREYRWTPYEFSWRWGLKGNPGHQGYHGLKGIVHNDLIQLGAFRWDWRSSPAPRVERGKEGSRYYLWSSVRGGNDCRARILKGGLRPSAVWVNHTPLSDSMTSLVLRVGSNPLLLRYNGVGSGYVVFEETPGPPAWKQVIPLSTDWYCNPSILPFDCRPQSENPADWYRFTAPPGLRSITLGVKGNARLWVNGDEVPLKRVKGEEGRFPDGTLRVMRADLAASLPRSSALALRIQQERGFYGGAAIPDGVLFDCGPGLIEAGDLSGREGLGAYSGGLWYRKNVSLTEAQCTSDNILLDLGSVVASAEVHINGKPAGTRVAPPWWFDLKGKVRAGENRIEVLVYNTLGNHYSTTPSRYTGSTQSGLLGPVRLLFH